MSPIPPIPKSLANPVEIIPSVTCINDREVGLEIEDDELDTLVETNLSLGPRRTYRQWRELQQSRLQTKLLLMFQPPVTRRKAFTGKCIQQNKKLKVPETSKEVYSNKGDWLAHFGFLGPLDQGNQE